MKVIREYRDALVQRVRILAYGVVAVVVVIAGAFWFVQGVKGEIYRELAENNRLRKMPLRPPRGLIEDRGGELLVENIPGYNLLLDRSRTDDLERSLAFAAGILEVPLEELRERLGRFDRTPGFQPVLLAQRLSLAQVARFGVAALEYPEFDIDIEHLRLYRYSIQTGHVLGYLGQPTKEELARNPRYQGSELVGKRGVEQTYDEVLRGERGQRIVVVDSRGEVLREYERETAHPGLDLRLNLDLRLQQEAGRQLRGRVGAVVALDPRNGEVLVLYSSPGYNPNRFARGLSRAEWQELLTRPHNPLQNRAIQNAHPPGSVFKIVMAAAGLTEGLIEPEDRVYCRGWTTIYNHRFHCGRRQGHGWVNLEQALERSCNIYFYQLGEKLGIETIARYARSFGLGSATGIDLDGETAGLVPDPTWSLRARGHRWYPGETISLAVGQGPLLVTPLQLARMTAAVANGGRLVVPRLVRGVSEPPSTPALGIDPEVLRTIRRGLTAVVNRPQGTGYWFARMPEITVAGKTGTAQVVSGTARSPSEEVPYEERTHAWFVSFAPAESPELVLVVFVEHGGAGSTAAAPIAKALYETYFQSGVRHAQAF